MLLEICKSHIIYDMEWGRRAQKPKESAMTQENINNMKNIEFQQKQIMMVGGLGDDKKQKLSPETIKQMKTNYIKMYYGFVSINWGMGKTLGVAWQKALEQMDGFIATKAKIVGHPINNELIKFHKEFRHDMAKTIMTNPYTEEKLPERLKKIFFDDGTKRVKESKGVLDSMYQQYMPKNIFEKTQVAHKFALANQKTQQMLQQLLMQQIRQRAA